MLIFLMIRQGIIRKSRGVNVGKEGLRHGVCVEMCIKDEGQSEKNDGREVKTTS